MAEHLTPLDATFLELEEADESAHMHVGAIMVFERPPAGRPPSREEVCTDLAHDSVPDLDVMLDAMESSIGELVRAARGRDARAGSRTRYVPVSGVMGARA
jgi:hypothetical protein